MSYTISEMLSQLTLDDSSQWHPIVFIFEKMISIETWYKIYDGELLVIIEIFKTWRHNLEGYKHKIFIPTDYNYL